MNKIVCASKTTEAQNFPADVYVFDFSNSFCLMQSTQSIAKLTIENNDRFRIHPFLYILPKIIFYCTEKAPSFPIYR